MIELVGILFNRHYETSRKIAEYFVIDPDKLSGAAALAKPGYPLISAFCDDGRYYQRVLCDYQH